MKRSKIKYIHFTEETNSVDFLEKVYYFVKRVEEHPNDWKWVIISLHDALYGFAICALKGTNDLNVTYQDKNGRKNLISFGEAIKRCQDSSFMTWLSSSKTLQLNEYQVWAIKKLHEEFRNHFEHYQPIIWSIEIHGFPDMTVAILDIIKFLSTGSGNFMHLSKTQIRKIKSNIFKSRLLLKEMDLYKESSERTIKR